MSSQELGNLLEEARLRRGLSGRKAAAELGIMPMTWAMWRDGAWEPERKHYDKIAEFCGVRREVILGLLGLLETRQVALLLLNEDEVTRGKGRKATLKRFWDNIVDQTPSGVAQLAARLTVNQQLNVIGAAA